MREFRKLIGPAVMLLLLFAVYGTCVRVFVGSDKATSSESQTPWGRCGVFGDSFGALTCFFTALAVFAAYQTFKSQASLTRQNEDLQARTHLPLLLLIPQEGEMTFMVTSQGVLTMNLILRAVEKNVSETTALGIAHKTNVTYGQKTGRQMRRRLNVSEYLIKGDHFNRNDSFFAFGYEPIVDFLECLTATDVKKRPVACFERCYRNFLKAYGRASQLYRVELADYTNELSLVLQMVKHLRANSEVTTADLQKIFPSSPAKIRIRLRALTDSFILECSEESVYRNFCKRGSNLEAG